MGCCMGEALLRGPFRRVRGGEGCRCPVGNGSSSTCSGDSNRHNRGQALAVTLNRRLHLVLDPGHYRGEDTFLWRTSKALCLFLPSLIHTFPRCFSVKARKAPFIVTDCFMNILKICSVHHWDSSAPSASHILVISDPRRSQLRSRWGSY